MKSAKQVREYVRRRFVQEGRKNLTQPADYDAAIRFVVLSEILEAFDTPHKTKLKMPEEK